MNSIFPENKSIRISTNKNCMDVPAIHAFLSDTYWGKNRSVTQIRKAIKHSLCFGVFDSGKQIGFARVVSDYTFFTYIFDVYILPEYQNQGLGKWLCQTIMNYHSIRKTTLVLASKELDFYRKLGFRQHENPERILVLAA